MPYQSSALANLRNLSSLDLILSYNQIGEEGIDFLNSAFEKLFNLQYLALSFQIINNNILEEGANEQGISLEKCTNLQNLKLYLKSLKIELLQNTCYHWQHGKKIYNKIKHLKDAHTDYVRFMNNKVYNLIIDIKDRKESFSQALENLTAKQIHINQNSKVLIARNKLERQL
ncbi:hypothetical protein ABPG72_021894 [Tetrahymena utriculariae]